MWLPRLYCQWPHSEIPICIILYYFAAFARPLKPIMFIFPLLIFYTLIQVSIFYKLYLHSGSLLENSCLKVFRHTQFRPVSRQC